MKTHGILLFSLMLLISVDVSASISGWTQRANFGTIGRHRAVGIAIGNKGYMGFGHYNGAGPNIVLKDWWQYDPSNGTWTQKADYIGNGGNGTYAPLTFGMDDCGFVGGGQVASSTEFYKYDPMTNLWTPATNSPTLSQNHKAFTIGNKGYYIDAFQLYEYNADIDVWMIKNMAPFDGGYWNSTFVIGGKGYSKDLSNLWEYNPTLDQWTARAPFPGLASRGSAGFAQNSKGYIVCGYAGGLSNVQGETWEFDPALNQWTQLLDFPGNKRRFCSGFNIGNRAFMGIGTNGTNFTDFWEFDRNEVFASIDEETVGDNFSTYPNPAIEYVNFESDDIENFDINIYDLTGKLISSLTTTTGKCTYERDNMPSGVYLYHVIYDQEIIHQQRIILN